jgi:hypothetical protein
LFIAEFSEPGIQQVLNQLISIDMSSALAQNHEELENPPLRRLGSSGRAPA